MRTMTARRSLPTAPPQPMVEPQADPVQMILYGPGVPEIVEGTATTLPDGTIFLDLPIDKPPAAGTTVQIILYTPGTPDVVEGVTGTPAPDGTFEILPIR